MVLVFLKQILAISSFRAGYFNVINCAFKKVIQLPLTSTTMTSKVLLFRAPANNDSKNADSYEEFLGKNGVIAESVNVLEFQFVNIDKLAVKLHVPNSYSGKDVFFFH